MKLAQIQMPVQAYTEPVSPAEGLKTGTIWRELSRPFFPEVRA